jgi:hypothetical protein
MPRGEVYMFSAFLGAYVLVLTAIILLIIKSRRAATPVPAEEREACALRNAVVD